MVCDRVFTAASGKKLADSPGYRAHYGWVADQGERFDEAVALVFASPHSYTGEDVVELTCHGGTHLVRRLLQTLLAAGARLAQPGEFTRRAFLNGKMGISPRLRRSSGTYRRAGRGRRPRGSGRARGCAWPQPRLGHQCADRGGGLDGRLGRFLRRRMSPPSTATA